MADFYDSELNQELQKERAMRSLSRSTNQNGLLDINNLDMTKLSQNYEWESYANNDVLDKLNYIISMFEEQKTIKTKQKNEEVVLYCF